MTNRIQTNGNSLSFAQMEQYSRCDRGVPVMTEVELTLLIANVIYFPTLFHDATDSFTRYEFNQHVECGYSYFFQGVEAAKNGSTNVVPTLAEIEYALQQFEDSEDQGHLAPNRHAIRLCSELIARIRQVPNAQLDEGVGRQLLYRFLKERQVYLPLKKLMREESSLGIQRLPSQLDQLLRAASDDLNKIDEHCGSGREQRLQFITSSEFSASQYEVQWHVPGVLVRGQPCVVGGPSKTLKTSVVLDLAISLASRTTSRFLGTREVEPASVLFFSAEMGGATIRSTAQRICIQKGLQLGQLDITWCFEAPRLDHVSDMRAIRAELENRPRDIVIVDPLYLCLLSNESDVSPDNLFAMGPLLRKLSKICTNCGATPILIHHFNKAGSMSRDPPSLENLAYAGISEFARQWMLLSRREPYNPETGQHHLWLNVGGSVGFSHLWAVDINEGVLQDDLTGRHWQVEVSTPSESHQAGRHAREVQREEVIDQNAARILNYLLGVPSGNTMSQIRAAVGLGETRCMAAIRKLLEQGRIERTSVRQSNHQGYVGYRCCGVPRLPSGSGEGSLDH